MKSTAQMKKRIALGKSQANLLMQALEADLKWQRESMQDFENEIPEMIRRQVYNSSKSRVKRETKESLDRIKEKIKDTESLYDSISKSFGLDSSKEQAEHNSSPHMYIDRSEAKYLRITIVHRQNKYRHLIRDYEKKISELELSPNSHRLKIEAMKKAIGLAKEFIKCFKPIYDSISKPFCLRSYKEQAEYDSRGSFLI